jgi:MFS superfamily sulfate permease-like transporter
VSGKEFVVWMATFLSCLFIGVDVGLAIGVGVALAFLFSSLASTGVQTLVKVPHTDDFMDVAEVAHHCGAPLIIDYQGKPISYKR